MRGMTQVQAAEALGISRTHLVAVEGGRFAPSMRLVQRMATLVHVDVTELAA